MRSSLYAAIRSSLYDAKNSEFEARNSYEKLAQRPRREAGQGEGGIRRKEGAGMKRKGFRVEEKGMHGGRVTSRQGHAQAGSCV